MPTTQPIERNDELEEWIGEWFLPLAGKYYLVPSNSINHKSEAGRVGVCIDYRLSNFNMSWALLHYEPETDKHDEVWVRTMFLAEVDKPSEEEFTIDQIRGSLP